MRVPAPICAFAVCLTLGTTGPGSASAQVPTVESQPRLAVPPRGVTRPAAPTEAAAPAAQTPGQPTTAPAADPAPATDPAPVSAAPPPSGVTPLPPAAAPPTTASSSAAATAKDSRGYAAANFGLKLDGIQAGALKSVEGGAAVGEVVVERMGPDQVSKKHLGGVKYEDLSFEVSFDSKSVTDWIAATWKGSSARKSGSVVLSDYNYSVRGEREFKDAIITATTIPALDAGAKDPAFLKVTIAPESVREIAGSGKAETSSKSAQKLWRASNFRFEMGDLETFVKRIESFTIGQKVTESGVGEERIATKQPATLEFPNLKISMLDRPSPNWEKWKDEFLLKGNSGEAQEKNGAIVFLDASLKNELGRINLFNCGLIRLGADRQEAMKEKAATVSADLYCERMELAIKN